MMDNLPDLLHRLRAAGETPDREVLDRIKAAGPPVAAAMAHREQKVGRNELCPHGSGKKYMKCHGA